MLVDDALQRVVHEVVTSYLEVLSLCLPQWQKKIMKNWG